MARYILGEDAARKLRGLFNAGAAHGAAARQAHTLERVDLPPAWTVRYSTVEDGYIIYLPSTALLDGTKDALESVRASLTAAGNYGDNWYKMDLSMPEGASSTGGVYPLYAEINYDPSDDVVLLGWKVGEDRVIPQVMRNILIANLHYNNGDSFTRAVEQLRSGSIELGLDRRAFGYYGIEGQQMLLRRPIYKLAGLTRRAGDSDWMRISYSDSNFPGVLALQTPAHASTAPACLVWFGSIDEVISDDSLEHTNLPLYEFDTDGWLVADYRELPTDVRWEA